MKKLKKLEGIDWIVIRLLAHTIRSNSRDHIVQTDIIRTVSYLMYKYTKKTIRSAIGALLAENKPNKC